MHPPKKPTTRLSVAFNRARSVGVAGWFRDIAFTAKRVALVTLPVMTAVEGTIGQTRRSNANWQALAEKARIAAITAIRPCGAADGFVITLNMKTTVSTTN